MEPIALDNLVGQLGTSPAERHGFLAASRRLSPAAMQDLGAENRRKNAEAKARFGISPICRNALDHPTRRGILALLNEHPKGLTIRQIRRRLSGCALLEYHLSFLAAVAFVQGTKAWRSIRFTLNVRRDGDAFAYIEAVNEGSIHAGSRKAY